MRHLIGPVLAVASFASVAGARARRRPGAAGVPGNAGADTEGRALPPATNRICR